MSNLTPLEIQKQLFARKFKGFDSDEVRDAYFKTGMKEGWAESLDKLEEMLEGK